MYNIAFLDYQLNFQELLNITIYSFFNALILCSNVGCE